MSNRYLTFVITFLLLILAACRSSEKKSYISWPVYGGSKDMIRYSTLDQVDSSNVSQLQVAWTYNTGDADTVHNSQIQCNPIMMDGVLYGTSPKVKLFAIDASTGKTKWVFNPFDSISVDKRMFFVLNNCRGVTYWSDGKDDKRIFYTAGSDLLCVDANTGKLVTTFANGGHLDLHTGLGTDIKDLFVTATTPGIVYKDLIITGSRVDEGPAAAAGHIRAFDVHTGKMVWIFHTIPQPGETGYETWDDPNAYLHIGGANNWSGMALDEQRGILFAPTGSASFDFYGGKRTGQNLFADCLLALDANTGKRIWHFQDIHHDVWDRDIPSAPALVSITHDGKKVDAVAQTTKTGFVFLFDRQTGNPIFPIEEKPVPTDTKAQGEKLWPTQPIPTLPKPFVRQLITENELNNLVPDSSYQDIKARWNKYRKEHMFAPLSPEGTIVFPGLDGGAEWGGPAFDPSSGILYVNANEMGWAIELTEKNLAPKKENYAEAGLRLYQQHCVTCHGPERKGSGNFPSIVDVKSKYNVQQFSELINSGRRMMPSFKQLSEEEKSAITTYILEQKSNPKKIFPPQPLDTFRNLRYGISGYNKFLTKEGYPAIKPPWGTLNAINLNTGELAWKVPLGDYPEFKAKGISTGTENYGGPVVTAGGLVFIAATSDSKIRAFSKYTGKLLWEHDLPVPGFATPSIYELNGKQYIVIACGGGKLGKKSGDAYIAFALPGK